ncbi:MAG: N-6 DNA methylase [Pelodictyon phaeoclathratiforme]
MVLLCKWFLRFFSLPVSNDYCSEVATIMPRVLAPEPGMEIYDPCTGSGGLLVKCEIAEELNAIELEARETDEALRNILR